MKKIILVFISLTFIFEFSFAQFNDSINIEINKAISLINGSNGRFETNNSLSIIKKNAHKGNAKAMNALGLIYMNGSILPLDTLLGLQWLKLSGENNYALAWHNLGIIYKYGRSGVQLDYAKAFHYMTLSADAQYPVGMYDAGYMLYKGLGCKQNYEKAVQYFINGANHNYSSCMYMLGLCYRNGYGIERNMGDAYYWLQKAKENGHSIAQEELSFDNPENILGRFKVKGTNNTITSPEKYKPIKHLKSINNNLLGEYEGILITYDWSGEHVINESQLSISIYSNTNDRLFIEWREPEVDTMRIEAVMQDTSLIFKECFQKRIDHYSKTNPVLWNFKNAKLNLIDISGSEHIVGNLQMYSPETMEPQRPLYLSLKKKSRSDVEFKSDMINQDEFNVYPNPFYDGLNIEFYQTQEANVKVCVYSSDGLCIYNTDLGKHAIGQQNLTLRLSLKPGAYVLKMFSGTKQHQTVIVKK